MDSTLIIAEMACSHEGDLSLAKKIIDATARANADAIQLQIWSLDYMMAPQRKEYELLKKIEFTREEWKLLIQYIKQNFPNLQIYVCVYEHSTIDFIDSLNVDGYKINSSDLSNQLVLEKIAEKKKPINLSVGASTILEIEAAINQIQNISNSKVTLMYGHQSFPTKPENVHMNFIKRLIDHFQLPVGYQDHSDANLKSAYWLPAASLGIGVSILEQHITHDRSKKGIDHESALNPNEFIEFVHMVRCIDSAKGLYLERPFTEEEIKYRSFQKKSIVILKDLKRGDVITMKDIAFMRADKLGLSPNRIDTIIGKKLIKDISAFNIILEDDVK